MEKKDRAEKWFNSLREKFINEFLRIEEEIANKKNTKAPNFELKSWSRTGGGGGLMSIMRGDVFEKVGVNVSAVHGLFSEEFMKQIPGAESDPQFFATGISIVAHVRSPLIPAMHFNTRYIETSKTWFGGGGDLTPTFEDPTDTKKFHDELKEACDMHDKSYYTKFKKQCDEYFYLPHRNEPRGVGGIFYDNLSTNFEDDFLFTKDIGKAVLKCYPEIVRKKMHLPWSEEQKHEQLIKRGRYAEFNLLHDRGTKFGIATGGNIEAIFMSLPPEVRWP
ncbi:MAG TPA: oxygen-dependent coproporphyrinogen oxidase [Candidatus Megaira endosymbiont of Nemacystus decipiens]|nr:oxygen-dependent coproporphyrinogen oxidase [Candidatus Megaera endosymbiont of Nemacystus decipiens]